MTNQIYQKNVKINVKTANKAKIIQKKAYLDQFTAFYCRSEIEDLFFFFFGLHFFLGEIFAFFGF